ncbi:uncharacterized protein K444DRAFT_486390, partial [Hyaloscypha bicolor E]
YLYEPLKSTKEIRLLTLFPGAFLDPIRTSLSTFDIEAGTPHYEALTYTWGDPSLRHVISLHGHEFEITASLYEALKHLRLIDKKRIIWVDAICINMNNLAEHSNQVMMMRDIYPRALRVLVWLGIASEN